MMVMPVRWPYSTVDNEPTSLMPRLPLTLHYRGRSVEALGLLDTGAAVNILSYQVGLALGADWAELTTSVSLTGNLGRSEARGLIVMASHPQLTLSGPVPLAFAWTREETIPVIFGQINFFMLFDVCFYRAQGMFEVHSRESTLTNA